MADSLGESHLAAHASVLARQVRHRWLISLGKDTENGLCEAAPHLLADCGMDDLAPGPDATLAELYRAVTGIEIVEHGSLCHGHQDGEGGAK